ncbi:hypothetical protein Ancab_029278 [Ancistrocladus abbreviatus]
MNMMKESSIYPREEIEHVDDYEFDPQTDFAKFLEEAKRYADKKQFDEERAKKQPSIEKKSRKSWKKTIFSFWKSETESSKPHIEQSSDQLPNPKCRGHVSGPLHRKKETVGGRHRHPTSGPIINLFSPKKRAEDEIPYVCLKKLTRPQDGQTYGPVYRVT